VGVPELDVYFSNPATWSDGDIADARSVLSPDERARAARFRFERDHRLYVAAHSMLRRALAERLSVAPLALEFDHNAYGRPELGGAHARALRFSLSHSHGMALCAITRERDIGVDVEPIERELPLGVAERCFAPFELADVLGLSAGERGARFFTYWTLKEAYVKARGVGLSLPVARIAFVVSEGSVEFRPDAEIEPSASDWCFRSFRVADTHQAALALRGSAPFSVRTHRVR
jgi:4'-phosphopantetheinyl transferase